MPHIKFPLQFDARRRTAASAPDDHIREMIELVLFTNPGERVNRPDFGCGVMHNLFAANSIQLAASLQASMAAALNRWLGDVIEIQFLDVSTDESKLLVALNFIVRGTGETRSETFARGGVA